MQQQLPTQRAELCYVITRPQRPVQQGQEFSAASPLMGVSSATQCSCLPLQSVSEDAHVDSLPLVSRIASDR